MNELRIERITAESAASAPIVGVYLDNAPQRNALSLENVEQLRETLISHPEETLIFASTTPGIFSAGADLHATDSQRARLSDVLYECYELMIDREGCAICVVDGAAVGGGAQLTTACDVRVMSARARWRWVGPGHGLAVGAWILPEIFGRSRGLDLTLSGRWLESAEAETSGFAELARDPWQRALDYAAQLAQAQPAAISRVRSIATYPHIRDALRRERSENKNSWSGAAPSARDAARAGKGLDDSQ